MTLLLLSPKCLALLPDFQLPALCSQFPCLAGFTPSLLDVCAIAWCDWHPEASSICPLQRRPPALHSFASTSSVPGAFLARRRPHLRGFAPRVSTAFRSWKTLQHQYFEVTPRGFRSVADTSFHTAPFVVGVLRSKS